MREPVQFMAQVILIKREEDETSISFLPSEDATSVEYIRDHLCLSEDVFTIHCQDDRLDGLQEGDEILITLRKKNG